MEIRELIASRRSKAQLFSIATLLFGLMVISALLIFVVINIGYDSISQSSIISSSSSNLGMILKESAGTFAESSGSAALNALYMYESNASLRKSNFISNFSEFMQYLMVNGTIPGVQQGSNTANIVSGYMLGATFTAYNSEISGITGAGSKQVSINETAPQISQGSPYSISVSYTEYVSINTTTGRQSFSIPVSASIPINNTPDLFYAQQGIYRPIKPSGLSGLATVISNDYASYGTTNASVYGTIYLIPSPTTCAISISSKINTPPYNAQIIIATPNANAITAPGCSVLDTYGGLITEKISATGTPIVPYLVFSGVNNVLQSVSTGQPVLLYGPGLSLLNISGLRSAVDSGDFFASPFAPSYIQRASGDLAAQSPSGISTFSGYGRTAPRLNSSSQSSNSIVLSESQNSVSSYTVSAWVYPTSQNGIIVGTQGSPAQSLALGIGKSAPSCSGDDEHYLPSSFFFGDVNGGTTIGVNTVAQFQLNRWYFVAGTFNSVSGGAVSASQFRLYINGVNVSASACSVGSDTSPLASTADMQIGGAGFNGIVSGVQVYDSALTQLQIYKLYRDGMFGLPASNAQLAGWYPLDGNANDLSGNGYYQVSSTAPPYVALPSYSRDSALPAVASQPYPIPGTENCDNNTQCVDYALPHIYLSDNPLELDNGGISAAYFDGTSSYFEQSGGYNFMRHSDDQPFSISIWVYPISDSGVIVSEFASPSIQTELNRPMMELYKGDLYINVWKNNCVKVGLVPAGEWSNLVFADTGNQYYGYINTVEGHDHGAGLNNGLPSGISTFYALGAGNGVYNCGSGLPFHGMMADFQFYNITLDQQQINQIYGSGIDAAPFTTTNSVGWWPLNGNGADYAGQDAGFGNSLAYEFMQSNFSEVNSLAVNPIGLSTVSGVSGEWQSVGFPTVPFQQVRWNVTAWNLPSDVQAISYEAISSNPIAPSSTVPVQIGSFFSGLPGADQGWSFGTAKYRGANFFGSPAMPFPQTMGVLNANVSCAEPFNSTGYTAATNMTLSGAYNFSMAYDDRMEVFYRQVGSGTWSHIFDPGAAWPDTSPGTNSRAEPLGPVRISFPAGNYQIVVDWMNGCSGGLSTFQMTKG